MQNENDKCYFSHDSNAQRDKKLIQLRKKEDWYGYGLYWAIVERLREAKDYKLETDYDYLAYDMQTQSDRIQSVVENYDLFKINADKFWSESLLRRMKIKQKKSEQARDAALIMWEKKRKNKADA